MISCLVSTDRRLYRRGDYIVFFVFKRPHADSEQRRAGFGILRSLTKFRATLPCWDSMRAIGKITSPSDSALDRLCHELAERASALDAAGEQKWPKEQLALCAKYGVFGWFLPREWGGQDWNQPDTLRAVLRLSAACLTTTFVLTQLTGASRRIDGGFELEGCIPWVTGACCADYVVTGAQLDDDQQVVVALPMDDVGVDVSESVRTLGAVRRTDRAGASETGQRVQRLVNRRTGQVCFAARIGGAYGGTANFGPGPRSGNRGGRLSPLGR